MKIFVIGTNNSGKTKFCQEIVNKNPEFIYYSYNQLLKNSFGHRFKNEPADDFLKSFEKYSFNILFDNPKYLEYNYYNENLFNNVVIDDIFSPTDFIKLFDYKNDIVVFLNRTDISEETLYSEQETVFVNLCRDYCFWLATVEMLNKKNWQEYNFKMTAPNNGFLKVVGIKNTLNLTSNLEAAIDHFNEYLKNK